VSSPQEAGKIIKDLFDQYNILHCIDGPKDDISDFYIKCSQEVGELVPMEEDSTGDKTGKFFTDVKYPWKEESTSFSHSNTRQPFHTDGSYEANAPEVTFFCCLRSPDLGGATIFVDANRIKSILSIYFPYLLSELEEEIVTHEKGNDLKTKPILQNDKLTWNYFRCNDCSIKHKFHNFLENYIIGANLYDSIYLKKGEALFFKDEELLHGRTAFLGNRWLVKGGLNVRPRHS
jgi:alpha-ketoglutarate-dependent taurine dioxygenase